MTGRVIAAAAAGLATALITWPCVSRADVTVIGGGYAADCSKDAKAVSANRPDGQDSIHECTLALENELLSAHDLASTYVNRGVIYISMAQYELAIRDFDAAQGVEPQLPEAFINRGAALIGEGRNTDGIAEINKGLALSPSEPEKAYFNRALAEERLNDLKSAYFDYKKALELKPDWTMAKDEISRFTVVQK
jgi:tetratricopeptide (TPR) repeat protein